MLRNVTGETDRSDMLEIVMSEMVMFVMCRDTCNPLPRAQISSQRLCTARCSGDRTCFNEAIRGANVCASAGFASMYILGAYSTMLPLFNFAQRKQNYSSPLRGKRGARYRGMRSWSRFGERGSPTTVHFRRR